MKNESCYSFLLLLNQRGYWNWMTHGNIDRWVKLQENDFADYDDDDAYSVLWAVVLGNGPTSLEDVPETACSADVMGSYLDWMADVALESY